jgi:transcriptional regulator with XRE-family HTH domain
MEDIRQVIMHIINKKGWTQKEAAKKAMVSEATMSDIANLKKNPDSITIQKFATAFGVSLMELYGYKIEANNEVKTIDDSTNEQRKQLIEWALKVENQAYLEFANRVSKHIPSNMLDKLEFTVKFNTGGGNVDE